MRETKLLLADFGLHVLLCQWNQRFESRQGERLSTFISYPRLGIRPNNAKPALPTHGGNVPAWIRAASRSASARSSTVLALKNGSTGSTGQVTVARR